MGESRHGKGTATRLGERRERPRAGKTIGAIQVGDGPELKGPVPVNHTEESSGQDVLEWSRGLYKI